MDNPREKVFNVLDALNVEYQLVNHPTAFTVEEMDNLNLNRYGTGCKNLFLSDDKGRRHFRVVLHKDKSADLKSIQAQLGCIRLGRKDESIYSFFGLTGQPESIGVLI